MVSIFFARSKQLTLALPALDGLGLLTGVLYLLFFAFGFASFTDPDYWWHLRTGQLIVETFSIPRQDVYSFTAAGQPWLTHAWLSEVLIYLGVSWLGYAATLGLFLSVILTAFGLMQRLLRRLGTPRIMALALVGLGMLISLPFWTVRPQMLSWLLIAVFISILTGRRAPPLALVGVMALWTNLHLGYILGLGVLVLWFVSLVWSRLADDEEGDLRGPALFVAACFAATLLNPNGPMTLLHSLPFVPFIGGALDLQAISEWRSPNFHVAMHLPLLAGIVVLIGLALRGGVRDRFALLLAVAFAVLALQASRYQPWFAIAYLPAAGLAARELRPEAPRIGAAAHSAVNWALIVLTAVAVLVTIPALPNPQVHRQAIADGRVYYPSAALTWLREHRPDANVFAQYEWGGYFIDGLYPEGHVYIDGRADMYGARILGDYFDIMAAEEGWEGLLEESGADTVVVERTKRLASALRADDDWSLALEGPAEDVFIRR